MIKSIIRENNLADKIVPPYIGNIVLQGAKRPSPRHFHALKKNYNTKGERVSR
jgi:hypothetical protein